MQTEKPESFTSKDLVTDQEVRWCPGCGDYSILKQVQTVIPELGLKREEIVFVSGIGCSSRFPYYMDTYGMHSIHGRATAIATGLKLMRPELSVWLVTGDGDALSIGGNHFIHMLRRNPDVNVLLFNNEIYGLTKGQYSPTSHEGQVTKSTPYGSLDHPFNPATLCMGAGASFVARSMDRDPLHLREILRLTHQHKGTSVLEIYQNCNVFNDGAFEVFTEKSGKKRNALFLESGKPLVFGEQQEWGIRLNGLRPEKVNLNDGRFSVDDLWIHDPQDRSKAMLLCNIFDDPRDDHALPRPFGVLFQERRDSYEDLVNLQVEQVRNNRGEGDLDALLRGRSTWEIL